MQPIILAVDDDLLVLRAIERDLRANFGDQYRVVTAGSGTEALQVVGAFRGRGAQIALLLADQRMPEMTGTQFLKVAMALEPNAKKVLLTAYSDTAVAIEAINSIGLDHYLTKPWDPPEETLVPVLAGLLDDWQATAIVPFEGIRVAGTLWSAYSHEVKDFLARNRVPYRWLDIEADPAARALVDQVDPMAPSPSSYFPMGRRRLHRPSDILLTRQGCKLRQRPPPTT